MYRMGISISYYPDNQWKQKSDSTDIERTGGGLAIVALPK
jgi:hypothetical protein